MIGYAFGPLNGPARYIHLQRGVSLTRQDEVQMLTEFTSDWGYRPKN